MNHLMKLFISIIFLSIISAQQEETESLPSVMGGNQPLYNDMSKPAIPLEGEIDPDKYLLGPGDQLHVVVSSMENKLFPGHEYDLFNAETIEYYEFIGPAGELSLPSIGEFDTKGKTYKQISDEIRLASYSSSYKK